MRAAIFAASFATMEICSGREIVGDGDGCSHVGDEDEYRVVIEDVTEMPPARQRLELVCDLAVHRRQQRRRGCHEDDLAASAVLGLRQQIRGDPCGVCAESARTRISLGPGRRSMATLPNSWRFASTT
jgi:hypothetical protein